MRHRTIGWVMRRQVAVSGRGLLRLFLALAGTAAAASLAAAEPAEVRGPDVTIIAEEERTVLEYRQGGVLRMVRVVPKWGRPYYLVPRDPTQSETDLERSETLLPSWVIVEF